MEFSIYLKRRVFVMHVRSEEFAMAGIMVQYDPRLTGTFYLLRLSGFTVISWFTKKDDILHCVSVLHIKGK